MPLHPKLANALHLDNEVVKMKHWLPAHRNTAPYAAAEIAAHPKGPPFRLRTLKRREMSQLGLKGRSQSPTTHRGCKHHRELLRLPRTQHTPCVGEDAPCDQSPPTLGWPKVLGLHLSQIHSPSIRSDTLFCERMKIRMKIRSARTREPERTSALVPGVVCSPVEMKAPAPAVGSCMQCTADTRLGLA